MKFPVACELDALVAEEPRRFDIDQIHFDGKRLRVTNGKSLIDMPVIAEEGDAPRLIPAYLFSLLRGILAHGQERGADMPAEFCEADKMGSIRCEGDRLIIEVPAPSSEGSFPNTDIVWPEGEPKFRFRISPLELINLLKGMGLADRQEVVDAEIFVIGEEVKCPCALLKLRSREATPDGAGEVQYNEIRGLMTLNSAKSD